MADQVCPPLGTGSVDLNELHKAAKAGDDLEQALASATTGGPPLLEPEPVDGKKLVELREIAELEGVDVTGLRRKDDVAAAIIEHREPPLPPAETDGDLA